MDRAYVELTLADVTAPQPGGRAAIRKATAYILTEMAKHLVDLDEAALGAARAELGTITIKETVNVALRQASAQREERLAAALDVLAAADLGDRADAWR